MISAVESIMICFFSFAAGRLPSLKDAQLFSATIGKSGRSKNGTRGKSEMKLSMKNSTDEDRSFVVKVINSGTARFINTKITNNAIVAIFESVYKFFILRSFPCYGEAKLCLFSYIM